MSSLKIEMVTFTKCGKKFMVTKGGFVPQPAELMLVCAECKLKIIKDILK